MRTLHRPHPLIIAATLVLPALPLAASTTIFNGSVTGTDSWNTALNWSGGVPSSDLDAVVASGKTAAVLNAATPAYTGSLTLESNALLDIGNLGGSQNAALASGIIFKAGAQLRWNINANISFPPMILEGNASWVTPFGASDNQTDNFAAVTGAHTLTINGFNNHTFNLNGTNTFSQLICDASDRYNIRAKAAGALGTGNVVVNQRGNQVDPNRSARLYFDVPGVMADTATLYLNGPVNGGGFAGDGVDWVVINHTGNEKIAALYIYGVKQPPGTYTSAEKWLGGSGTLTVEPISPNNPAPAFGAIVPAGDVELTWTNMPPNTGSDVWVDVWFGTAPGALTQVASGQLNLSSFTVTAPVAGSYYWRVDSYLNGSPTGTPLTGTVFRFEVNDTDGDGFPDAFELLHTTPPSTTALTPEGDRDLDLLTNWNEFQVGTSPSNPDTDDDGLLDGASITVSSGDSRYTAWAADVRFTDNGGQRTFRGENELATHPLKPDTDSDGLSDGVETDTDIWVSATNTGTDPLNPDTDTDGLKDGVETHTGKFVSTLNTGTSPHKPDTDADGAGDWYEIYASFTDPFIATSKPNIPYPLPKHDGSRGASDKRVKVYIMSGQSNMVGQGTVAGPDSKSLTTMTRTENKFPNLIDGAGNFIARQDVWYRGVISAFGNGPLAPGYGANSGTFGPELGFGQVMGWLHDAPVLLLKSSQGNRSLGWDVLPPGSVSYVYGSTNYGGYGAWGNWPVGGVPPTSGTWYAGTEFDRFFMDESEWAHPGTADINVVDVLDNWDTQYAAPGKPFAGQDFEIAGFVWWQGDKDRYDMGLATRYEQNLLNLITSLRNYYTNRYPGKIVPKAPFVLATLGQTTPDSTNAAEKAILDAQLAVDGDSGKYPQFVGNVKTVYSHPLSEGGASNSHYDGRAGTYMLVGDALGRAMVELEQRVAPPSGYATWIAGPFTNSLPDPNPALDFDTGGLATGLEWVLGGDPTNSSDDAGIIPTLDTTSDPDGKLLFTFRRRNAADEDDATTIAVQYGSDLAGWTTAIHQGNGVNDITLSEVAGDPGFSQVTVALPASLVLDGKLFLRLSVSVAQP